MMEVTDIYMCEGPSFSAPGKNRIGHIGLILLKQYHVKALGSHQKGLGENTLLNKLLAKWISCVLPSLKCYRLATDRSGERKRASSFS